MCVVIPPFVAIPEMNMPAPLSCRLPRPLSYKCQCIDEVSIHPGNRWRLVEITAFRGPNYVRAKLPLPVEWCKSLVGPPAPSPAPQVSLSHPLVELIDTREIKAIRAVDHQHAHPHVTSPKPNKEKNSLWLWIAFFWYVHDGVWTTNENPVTVSV